MPQVEGSEVPRNILENLLWNKGKGVVGEGILSYTFGGTSFYTAKSCCSSYFLTKTGAFYKITDKSVLMVKEDGEVTELCGAHCECYLTINNEIYGFVAGKGLEKKQK